MCHSLSKSHKDKIFAESEVWSLEVSTEQQSSGSFNFHMCACYWLRVQWLHWALTSPLTSSQQLLTAGCSYSGTMIMGEDGSRCPTVQMTLWQDKWWDLTDILQELYIVDCCVLVLYLNTFCGVWFDPEHGLLPVQCFTCSPCVSWV